MIGSILIFVAVLSLLILIHEFGHYYVAKKLGVWVEEFGLGIPPRAVGKKIGETIYSLNWLPFGGFVRLHGEENDAKVSKPKRAFKNKPKRVRVAIVTAGVVMNFLLAVVAFSIVYSFTGVPRESEMVKIVEIVEGSPAANAGLLAEDVVNRVDGEDVVSTAGFISLVEGKEAITMSIDRGPQSLEIVAEPRENPPEGEGSLGVVISTSEIYYPPVWQRPFYGIYYGFKEAIFWGQLVIVGFLGIFGNLFAGKAPEGLAGPVGIYAITSQAASYGVISLINFIGILSVNLAILNILPFPALDGGRLAFIFAEALWGKKVLPKVESYIHLAGMAFLILLLVAITFGDVKRLYENGWDVQRFLESFQSQ